MSEFDENDRAKQKHSFYGHFRTACGCTKGHKIKEPSPYIKIMLPRTELEFYQEKPVNWDELCRPIPARTFRLKTMSHGIARTICYYEEVVP
jgi:hypothetical protein